VWLRRQWHSLERSEQARYYEMARREKLLHKQLFPGWTARDNYSFIVRRVRRKAALAQRRSSLHRLNNQRGTAYSERVFHTNCALRIKKCAPRISSGIYFLSTSCN